MFILIFLAIHVFAKDPCHNFDRYWSRDDSLACLREVDFATYKSTFDDILETLLSNNGIPYMDLYCYRKHMKAGTGPPLNMKIDFYSELESLKTQEFDSWFDAQMALVNIFIKNRDAHTFWKADDFFGLVAKFFHPIGISSHLEEGDQIYKVSYNSLTRSWFNEYNQVFGTSIDFESMEGKIIRSIDGNNPTDFFHSFCDTNFLFSRDDGTCLNELLRNYDEPITETWFIRYPQLNSYPEGPVYYELEDPNTKVKENFTIDFLSCFYEAYYSPNCLNISSLIFLESLISPPITTLSSTKHMQQTDNNQKTPLSDTTTKTLVEQKHKNTRKYLQRKLDEFFNDEDDMNNATLICSFSEIYSAYYFNEAPDVVVLQILSFMVTNVSEEYSFIECFDKIHKMEQFTRMVIDLRDNGGGVIQWGLELAVGLMRTNLPSFLDLLPPLLVTETYRLYDPLSPGVNYNSDHKNAEFKEFDGSISEYPPYARLDSDEWIPLIPRDPIKEESSFTGYEPEDILIVTDGSCGSTCGMFTKLLMAMQGAKVLVFGGFVDEIMDVSSFDGASNQNIGFDNHMFGYSWAGVFPFSYQGSYDRSKIDLTKLMGFSVTSPDFRVYDWEGLRWADPRLVWEAIIQDDYVDVCVDSWSLKVDPSCEVKIEFGVYGRSCQNGKFDMTSECIIKRCEQGYYLLKDDNGVPKSCEKIEDAPVWEIFDEEQSNKDGGDFLDWWGWMLIGISSFALMMLFCYAACCCCCGGCVICFAFSYCFYFYTKPKRHNIHDLKKKPKKAGYEKVKGKEMGYMKYKKTSKRKKRRKKRNRY